ncbi:uncharacterized protein N7459_004302 [Penicillium hispanicum]|uniref:uncharacterized protein n=1 Tax=Penicillium hispanicum TaxID=1080232 RepID=UPI002540EB1A|nr:uncharacterized protein N7459_004302 [Penicillium hispanicum]KAJ5584502.1 hypothetical protein N7459_004302 [Penicillium hispanicum]
MKVVGAVHSYLSRRVSQIYNSPAKTLDLFWDFSRRYFYAVAFWSIVSAKLLHLYAHLHSLPPSKFFVWGPTFFFQDVVILLLLRTFAQKIRWRPLAAVVALFVVPFSVLVSGMAAANFSVYLFTGAEIHWRHAKTFTGDAAAMRTLLSGLTGFLIGEGILLTGSLFTAHPIHSFTGGILHVLAWPFRSLSALVRPRIEPLARPLQNRFQSQTLPDPRIYEQIALGDDFSDDSSDYGESGYLIDRPDNTSNNDAPSHPVRSTDRILSRVMILSIFCLFMLLRSLRPWDPVYLFLSGTLPLASVFEGGHRDSPVDATGVPSSFDYLNHASSLQPPLHFDWLPEELAPGFEDFARYDPLALHYNGELNPLHISNLEHPVLDSVKDALADGGVKIKHVILLKLESTRADVFPLRKNSFMYERIAETYKDKEIPQDVQKRIANLTRTAEYLTGFPSGFQVNDTRFGGKKAYGGFSARNAYTTSTYTLKSLTGTLCGVTPLVADFNREWEHHIYQPCLPHVLDMLSQGSDITNKTGDFTKWPWHSIWMQSVTEGYDNQDKLTPMLGYHDKKTKEIIESPNAEHPVTSEEINYYGYADTELREYIRDAIDDAERDHRRLFLTHLTGTTHHPWGLPNNTYEQIISSTKGPNEDLNHYLNAIGFVDDWLAEILDILEEKGVANETLIVMAGDHGLSLPNDGGITPYDNPHIGSFQVPIVLAHPHLPPVEISDPAHSSQIVPSIIDLLIESSSLTQDTTRVAKDICSLYEGQSLIRPLIQEKNGRAAWQFTVMNTGGSWLAVRSAARPEFRLVIPLVNDVEWRFTDLRKDPNELAPLSRFSLIDLANSIEKNKDYGDDVLDWLYDAAYVANWWVVENWHQYRYHPEYENKR